MNPRRKNPHKSAKISINQRNKKIVVAVSGGFDPIHIGHIRMLREAKKLGDDLVVILNNDNWLKQKKGFVFMPQKERKEIVGSIKYVDRVVFTKHCRYPQDMSVCRELEILKPDIFAKGGDRGKKDAKTASSSLYSEQILCKKLGIEIAFNVGRGGKIQSSSWLIKNILKNKNIHYEPQYKK